MFELMIEMKTKINTMRKGEMVDRKMNKVGKVGKTGSSGFGTGFSML
jgi:hypothetical protein